MVNMTSPSDTINDKATTIGPPMPNMEVKIVDPDTGETLPIGAVGELCSRGYHLMHGYYKMPEQTAETIDADGWLHSGDLASMDDRGYTVIEGRLKDMIIRGGENIYPKELEELLFAHESVAEVAVVGLPDDRWGETVGAFIRPAEGHSVDKQELFTYLRGLAAPHKTPKQWFSVSEFPLTGSGKIQKFKIREMWLNGECARAVGGSERKGDRRRLSGVVGLGRMAQVGGRPECTIAACPDAPQLRRRARKTLGSPTNLSPNRCGVSWPLGPETMLSGPGMALAAALAPKGVARPVMVLPGFTTGDVSTLPLRGFLRALGHRPSGWGLGINVGVADHIAVGIDRLLQEMAQRYGTTIDIVGWSAGGLLGRLLAQNRREMVGQVISLGSPIRLRSNGPQPRPADHHRRQVVRANRPPHRRRFCPGALHHDLDRGRWCRPWGALQADGAHQRRSDRGQGHPQRPRHQRRRALRHRRPPRPARSVASIRPAAQDSLVVRRNRQPRWREPPSRR